MLLDVVVVGDDDKNIVEEAAGSSLRVRDLGETFVSSRFRGKDKDVLLIARKEDNVSTKPKQLTPPESANTIAVAFITTMWDAGK